ncbi:hypothetical protein S40288_07130 [Stachybotrys chartarum IBT 40288]|nr:hypothetical protein S40288_07130 [Stachybotrys chartarum IBT 40288]
MASHADHRQQQYHHHPLPQPPQPPQHYDQTVPKSIPEEQQYYPRPQQHPHQQPQPPSHPQYQSQAPQPPSPSAKRRTFSFHSDKSQPRKGSGNKINLHETHEEKESKRLHSKADPTLAMNEAEPSAVAAMKMVSTVAPLRSLQHKDGLGNVIAEPDKSNPTRHRWERPLDTIRSFEAAIDGGYARKSIYRGVGAAATTQVSKPSRTLVYPRQLTYFSGQQSRYQQDSFYGSRPASVRPEYSHYGNGSSRNSYYEGQGFNGGYGPPANRHRAARQYSEPQFSGYGRESGVYPLPHKDKSYETVTSAAGSGNSDPAGYQTDPTSSDNSSIERASPPKRFEPVNDYGIGFKQAQSYQTQTFSVGVPPQNGNPLPPIPQDPSRQNNAPMAQKKVLRRHVPGEAQAQTPTPASAPTPAPVQEKRKSWLSRRFSKNS